MKSRRSVAVLGVLLLLAAGGAAAFYLANRPEVTTSSREAYRAYQEAVRNERRFYLKEARVGFARALELDPQFAMAMLGLARSSERDQQVSLMRRASRDKQRLTDRERLHVDLQLAGVERRRDDFLRIAQTLHRKYPEDIRAAMILAGREMETGHTDRAFQIFSELLAVEPNNAEAYNLIGYYHGYRGNYDKAIENIQKYHFMAPDQANPYDSLGEIQAYSGHYPEALANLKRALEIKPDFFPAYDHLGVAYEGRGDYAQAIAGYERAAQGALSESDRDGYLLKALRATFEAGDSAAAERLVARLRTSTSEFSELRKPMLQAALDLLNGRAAQAEQKLLETKPKIDAALSRIIKDPKYKPYEPGWNMLVARARIAQGRGADAIPLLEEMANPPNAWHDFESRRWVYEGRAGLAALLAERGDLDRADKLLEENRRWNPSWAPSRAAELAVARLRREKVLAAGR